MIRSALVPEEQKEEINDLNLDENRKDNEKQNIAFLAGEVLELDD